MRLLSQFVAEAGKIVPRRLTGVCTPHQRRLADAIKQARNIALLPFSKIAVSYQPSAGSVREQFPAGSWIETRAAELVADSWQLAFKSRIRSF